MNAPRKSSGNMTVLMSLTFAIIVGVCVIGLVANSLLFHRTRTQDDADAIAVTLANKLNEGNRIGQMNELETDSRELVFLSRKQYEQTMSDEPLLTRLADQLTEEARVGHSSVDDERRAMINAVVSDVQAAVAGFNQQFETHGLALPWLRAESPRITRVDVGGIRNIQSNVRCSDMVPDLTAFDKRSAYLEIASNLYHPDIKLALPEDGDLNFSMASLPACTNNVCAPSRNTNDALFQPYRMVMSDSAVQIVGTNRLPSAVQIMCESKVNGRSLELRSTAITYGASDEE